MELGQLIVFWIVWNGLKGIGQFIYDFQTLLTGAVALAAAYVAVKPVWKQLDLMQTQSNGVLREMLLQRQAELEQAQSAITKMIWTPLNDLWHEFGEFDDEPINEVQAHHHDQNISRGLAFVRHGYRWRDSIDVEAARGAASDQISALVSILNDVHAPAHTDQHDEDRTINDDDWRAFLARGETAKGEVEPALRSAREATTSIFEKMTLESAEIQDRLKKLDRALVAN